MNFIYFTFLTLSVFLNTAGATDQGNEYRIIKPSSSDSKIDTNFFDDGINKCIHEAQKYYDFEKDFLMFANNQLHQDIDYQYNVNDIITNLNKITKYKQHIDNIKNGIENIDSVLCYFLDNRLNYLKCRDEERKYRPYSINNQERLKNKVEAEVTFFQFSNYMITLLYRLTNPHDLSVKTRKYIRVSPTLWPLMNGEIEDLGHPDSATEDLDSFNIYLDPSERMAITYLNWCRETHYNQRVTPYERSLYDETWKNYGKISDLPYPDWLNPYKTKEHFIDLQVEEIDFIPNDSYTETPLSNDKTNSIECYSEEIEHSETIQLINDDEGASTYHPAANLVEEHDFESNLHLKKHSKRIYRRAKREEKKKKISDKIREISERKNNRSTSNEGILPPRGMRIFHSGLDTVSFETQILIDDLTGKHRHTLDAIFDPEQYANVPYKKFKSLWERINGKNSIKESTGSSHKALLDKNGQTVTGIFAHNDNMSYTKSTIPYIRYALELIGFGTNN